MLLAGGQSLRASLAQPNRQRAQPCAPPASVPQVWARGPLSPASTSSSTSSTSSATSAFSTLHPGLGRRHHSVAAASAAAAAAPLPASDGSADATEFDLGARVRAFAFFIWSLLLALPLFAVMLAMAPFVWLFDRKRRLAQHFANNVWGRLSTSLFYPIEVVGRENLPPDSQPVVYVSNHQSFMDIFSLFHLNKHFKFISKTSIFLIPIVGWSMFLTGHVGLNRVDRRSQLKCLQECRDLLAQGASVLFFPEGTRSKDSVMGGFKKGAFSVAVKSGVDVVPITLLGTGSLMPSGRELEMFSGKVRIVVHPRIPTVGRDAGSVTAEARLAVASALPAHLVGDATKMLEE